MSDSVSIKTGSDTQAGKIPAPRRTLKHQPTHQKYQGASTTTPYIKEASHPRHAGNPGDSNRGQQPHRTSPRPPAPLAGAPIGPPHSRTRPTSHRRPLCPADRRGQHHPRNRQPRHHAPYHPSRCPACPIWGGPQPLPSLRHLQATQNTTAQAGVRDSLHCRRNTKRRFSRAGRNTV